MKRAIAILLVFAAVVSLHCASFEALPRPQDDVLLTRYSNELDTLSARGDLDSILTAKARFIELFRENRRFADDGFRLLLEFYGKAIHALPSLDGNRFSRFLTEMAMETSKNRTGHPVVEIAETDYFEAFLALKSATAEDIQKKYEAEYSFIRKCRSSGINFGMSEGSWYYRVDFRFLLNSVLRDFRIPIKPWVEFMAQEEKIFLADDAHWFVPRDDVRKAIARREEFARKHPELEESREIADDATRLVSAYIQGISNSPAYDDDFRLIPEMRESFARYVSVNKRSAYHDLISGLYRRLQRNDFHLLNEECVSYLESQTRLHPFLEGWARWLRKSMKTTAVRADAILIGGGLFLK